MTTDNLKKLKFIHWPILILVVAVNLAIAYSTLTRSIDWGGDFSQYIMQADSLIAGTVDQVYGRNVFTVTQSSRSVGPFVYPWGYPLILSIVLKCCGSGLLALKTPNIFIYGLFLIALYLFSQKRLKQVDSLLLIGWFALSPELIGLADNILSDIPFLLASTVCIWAIDEYTQTEKTSLGSVIGVLAFAAYNLRTVGIFTLAALAVVHTLRFLEYRKDWAKTLHFVKQAVLPYLIFGILVAIQRQFLPFDQSSYALSYVNVSPQATLDNLLFYALLGSEAFVNFPVPEFPYLIFVGFFIISLLNRGRRYLHIYVYMLLSLSVFVFLPDRQGLRYILALLPFFIFFAYDGMGLAVRYFQSEYHPAYVRIYRVFTIFLIAVSAYMSIQIALTNLDNNRQVSNPDRPLTGQNLEMFTYVAQQTPPDSVIVFFKPRVMRWLTDRDAYMSYDCENLLAGDYVIIKTDYPDDYQIGVREIENCNSKKIRLEELQVFSRFTIYSINP